MRRTTLTLAASLALVAPRVASAQENRAPTAAPLTLELDEDTSATGAAQATDDEGDALKWSIGQKPLHGTLTLDDASTGSFTYAGARDYHGEDAFTLAVSDGKLLAVAKARVVVRPQNDAPELKPITLAAREDTPARATLVARDVDKDALTYAITAAPARGAASVDAKTGALTYTPQPDVTGDDVLTVQVTDGTASATADVKVTIAAVNDAPVASDGTLALDEDGSADGQVQATDKDGDKLKYTVLKPAAKGTVTVDASTGALRYQARADLHGADAFSIAVSDGALRATSSWAVRIAPKNDAPRTQPLALSAVEDATARAKIVARDVDGDVLRYELERAPTQGTAAVDAATGALTYTPSPDTSGTDSFTVKVSDASESATAEVKVTIAPVNDPPAGAPASFVVDEDALHEGTLAGADKEGDALSFSLARPARKGVVTIDKDGRFKFQARAHAHGADSFSFDVSDGKLRASAEVTVQITPVNDAPVAYPPKLSVVEDTAAQATIAWTDVDGDKPTFAIAEPPQKGEVVFGAQPGSFTYTPSRDVTGADAFVVTVSDGQAQTSARVAFEIRGVPDAPVAGAETLSAREDEAVEGRLPGSDADGDALTFRLTTQPTRGVVTLVDAKEGRVRYVPRADQSGSDAIGFEVSDGRLKAAGVLAVAIAPVNDAPEASALSLVTQEDAAVTGAVSMTDKDGDKLTIEIATPPPSGKLVVEDAAQGRVRFEPARDQHGAVVAQVVVFDGALRSAPVDVRVQVEAVNDAPVVKSGALATEEDVALTGQLVASDVDGDKLTFKIDAQSPLGTVAILNAATGSFRFTPATNKSGTGFVRFSVSDGSASALGMLNVRVKSVDDKPVASTATHAVPRVGRVQKTLSGYDPDGSPVTYEIVSAPTFGSVTLLDDKTGAFLFVTDGSASGTARFSFVVHDGTLTSAPAVVEMTVR